MIDIQAAINLVTNIIRFDKYEAVNLRAQDIASFCRMITGGDGLGEFVKELRPHEEGAQKEQRVRVYNDLSHYASEKILSYIERLKSVEDVKLKFNKNLSDDQIKTLTIALNNFTNKKSLLEYSIEAYKKGQKRDPNALLRLDYIDIKDLNGTVITRKIEPDFIEHDEQVYLQEKNNRIELGILKEVREAHYNSASKMGKQVKMERYNVTDFYLYADGLTLIFIRDSSNLPMGEDIDLPPQSLDNLPFQSISIERESGEAFVYKIYTFVNETLKCPLVRLSGRMDDNEEDVRTSILLSARPQFEELIRRKSELDVSINCHVFPQKFMVVPECSAQDEHGNMCQGGQISNKKCEKCKGTGHKYHISGQDVITISIPNNAEPNMIPDLTKMIHYATHDQFAPTFIKNEIHGILSVISDTTFSTNIFAGVTVAPHRQGQDQAQTGQNGIAKTATEILIDWQKMYLSLKEDSQQIERIYSEIADFQGALIGIADAETDLNFPKDFKFLTLDELILEYQNAINAKLPYDFIEKIAGRIIEKSSPDDPLMMAWGLLKLRFKPFPDKTDIEIATILLTRADDDYDRVLWENYDSIFDNLKEENVTLIGQDYKTQKEAIRQSVDNYFATIKYLDQSQNSINNLFNQVPN